MGQFITLKASDGHDLSAYRANPTGSAKGAVVVVQEIFGVNVHIRDVCDRLAADGFVAVAPALFDRLRPGAEFDYDDAGIAAGRELVEELGWDGPMRDIAAVAEAAAPGGRVGVTGFCWGGSVTFLAGCRVPAIGAAVVWYGRHIPQFLDTDRPQCPLMIHYGAQDDLIPPENRDAVAAAVPEATIFVYEGAGHGFNCDRRKDYRPGPAEQAWHRMTGFFAEHLTQD